MHLKICCIKSHEEAKIAMHAGANFLGLVGPMPSGPGIISNALIQSIVMTIEAPYQSILLSSETRAEAIISQYNKVKTAGIQIVDTVLPSVYSELKKSLPAVKIIQVIHVNDESDIEKSLAIAEKVDFLLLDSGNPNLKIKTLGGTGNTHDWKISRNICEQANCPVFLAGGIKSTNVEKAIETVQPFGIDLCSGLRTNDNLDPKKVDAFMEILLQY